MKNRYSTQDYNKDTMAKVLGKDLSISTKKSVEICSMIRFKPVRYAKLVLERVARKEQAVPFKRYKMEIPHRPGIGPGKYPVNASLEILSLIKSAEANAQQKGLDTDNLVIRHIVAHKAARPWHFGRQRRRKMKRTHIEIIIEEKGKKQEKKETKKEAKK